MSYLITLVCIVMFFTLSCVSSGNLLGNAVSTQSDRDEDDNSIGYDDDEEEDTEIYLSSDVENVKVYRQTRTHSIYVGTTPCFYKTKESRGDYIFLFSKENYYDLEIEATIPSLSGDSVHAVMQPRTGTLAVSVTTLEDYKGSWNLINQEGRKLHEGDNTIIMGENTVTLKTLGFREDEYNCFVPEGERIELHIKAEPIPFEGEYTSISQTYDYSPFTLFYLTFRATHSGTWHAELLDDNGVEVHLLGEGRIRDFETSLTWDGKTGGGKTIKDGTYSVKTTLISDEGETIVLEEPVLFRDRSTVFMPHLLHGSPGTLFTDLPQIQSQGFNFSAGGYFHESDLALSTFYAGAAWVPLPSWEAGFSLSFLSLDHTPSIEDDWDNTEDWGGASGWLKHGFVDTKNLDMALQLKGVWKPSVYIDHTASMHGLSAAVITGIMTGIYAFTIEPELVMSDRYAAYDTETEKPPEDLYTWMYLRWAGTLNYDLFYITLSGVQRTEPFREGLKWDSLGDIGLEIGAGLSEVSISAMCGLQYASSGFYTSGGFCISFNPVIYSQHFMDRFSSGSHITQTETQTYGAP